MSSSFFSESINKTNPDVARHLAKERQEVVNRSDILPKSISVRVLERGTEPGGDVKSVMQDADVRVELKEGETTKGSLTAIADEASSALPKSKSKLESFSQILLKQLAIAHPSYNLKTHSQEEIQIAARAASIEYNSEQNNKQKEGGGLPQIGTPDLAVDKEIGVESDKDVIVGTTLAVRTTHPGVERITTIGDSYALLYKRAATGWAVVDEPRLAKPADWESRFDLPEYVKAVSSDDEDPIVENTYRSQLRIPEVGEIRLLTSDGLIKSFLRVGIDFNIFFTKFLDQNGISPLEMNSAELERKMGAIQSLISRMCLIFNYIYEARYYMENYQVEVEKEFTTQFLQRIESEAQEFLRDAQNNVYNFQGLAEPLGDFETRAKHLFEVCEKNMSEMGKKQLAAFLKTVPTRDDYIVRCEIVGSEVGVLKHEKPKRSIVENFLDGIRKGLGQRDRSAKLAPLPQGNKTVLTEETKLATWQYYRLEPSKIVNIYVPGAPNPLEIRFVEGRVVLTRESTKNHEGFIHIYPPLSENDTPLLISADGSPRLGEVGSALQAIMYLDGDGRPFLEIKAWISDVSIESINIS